MKVGENQARLVVEHLLEVRDRPCLVGRVAGESAAEMVVDARRLPLPREWWWRSRGNGRPRCGGSAEAQLDQGGLRKLGRAADTSVTRVVACGDLGHRLVDEPLRPTSRPVDAPPVGPPGGAGDQMVGE